MAVETGTTRRAVGKVSGGAWAGPLPGCRNTHCQFHGRNDKVKPNYCVPGDNLTFRCDRREGGCGNSFSPVQPASAREKLAEAAVQAVVATVPEPVRSAIGIGLSVGSVGISIGL